MLKNRIKEIRTDKDLSQKTLAEQAGISRQALHAIENGPTIPSVEVALKLAKFLDTKVERLFWFDDSDDDHDDVGPFTLFDHKIVK